MEEQEELAFKDVAAEEEASAMSGQPLGAPKLPWDAAEATRGGRGRMRGTVSAAADGPFGDERLRLLVPMLLGGAQSDGSGSGGNGSGGNGGNGGSVGSAGSAGLLTGCKSAAWATLATHLPGRTGKECRERWARINAPPAAPSSSVSPEAAAAAAAATAPKSESSAVLTEPPVQPAPLSRPTPMAVEPSSEVAEAETDVPATDAPVKMDIVSD